MTAGREAPAPRRRLGALLGALAAFAMIAWPVAVWFGLTRWSLRGAALVLLALLAPLVVTRLAALPRARLGDVATLAFIPVITAALVGLSALLDHAGAVLAIPCAIHAVLLATFGATLASDRPMIERFARLQHPDLRPAEVAWCRRWTAIWCGFFLANLLVAGALALWAPLWWWTLYNGLIAYALIGLLVAVEWVLRKVRFGRFGRSLPERLLVRLVPAARRTARREAAEREAEAPRPAIDPALLCA